MQKSGKTQEVKGVGQYVLFLGQKRANLDQKSPNFSPSRIFSDHKPTFSERIPQK